MVARFELEAQNQARVDHPNICKVFEVGNWQGQSYIAMQFLKGETLEVAALGLSLVDKIRIMEAVAEAIHAAHSQGLIHRDLKPANIMVEMEERGPKPTILDFGLAKWLEATGLTIQGMVIGTTHYMAPEQARGDHEQVGRRTDVYGLGATLYRVLTGQVPFASATGMDVVRSTLEDDVPTLMRLVHDLPRDLDTIVRKCLEKDPSRRYESALAVAEDLRRWREGQPILARKPTLPYRAGKWARRHRLLVGVSAVALVGLLVIGSYAGWVSWTSASRAYWAQHFGQEAERIESLVRYAHLQPRHDIRPEYQQVVERMNRLQEQMKRSGAFSEGPASYALGRSHLALENAAKARTYLERAWSTGFRTPEVSYALGRTLGLEYQTGLEQARRIPDPELRQAKVLELQRTLRDPALQHLRAGAGVALESPDYYGALLAFYEQRHDDAVQLCRKALVQRPWFYEAKLLEGQALQAKAKELKSPQEILRNLPLAVEAFREAQRLAPSDAAACIGEAQVWRDQLIYGVVIDSEWRSPLVACEQAVTSAISIHANSGVPFSVLAVAMAKAGNSLYREGRDPRAFLQKSLNLTEQSLALDPTRLEAWVARIAAFEMLGTWKFYAGQDPFPDLEQGMRTASVALELESGDAALLGIATVVARRKMTLEMQHGRSSQASFEVSQQRVEGFLKQYPDLAGPHREIASLFTERAEYERTHGKDPRPSLERARIASQLALELDPNNPYLSELRGNVYLVQGQYEIMVSLNSEDSLRKALAFFEADHKWYSGRTKSSLGVVATLFLEAEARLDQSRDPEPFLAKAEQVLQHGLKAQLNDFWAQHLAGSLHCLKARWAHRRGQDPNPHLALAERYLRKSWEKGKWADTQAQLALLYGFQARWNRSSAAIIQGKASVRAALQAYPDHAEAWLNLGALEIEEARLAGRKRRLAITERAQSSIRRALELNSNLNLRAQRVLESLLP